MKIGWLNITVEFNSTESATKEEEESDPFNVDWSKEQYWVNYVATDRKGITRRYLVRPAQFEETWLQIDEDNLLVPTAPPTLGVDLGGAVWMGWESSLRERPPGTREGKDYFEVNWKSIPMDYKYVATNFDGRVFAYRYCPSRLEDRFFPNIAPTLEGGLQVSMAEITKEEHVSWCKPGWRFSLRKRP